MFTMGGELIGIPPSFEENVKAATKRIELRFVSANRGDAHTADRMSAMLRDAAVPVHGHVEDYACSAHADLLIRGCTRRTMNKGLG